MYDVVVLGAGPGGYVAAIKAAQLGAKVAIIEKETVGGICLNHGCIPTKTMLKSAKVFKTVTHASDFGVEVNGEVSANLAKMVERKNNVVKQLTSGVSFLLKKNKVDIISGYGEVLNAHEIQVGKEVIKTKKLIIATGGTPVLPPIDGVKDAFSKGTLVTSRELLNVTTQPKNLVIVGGGVIGVEFATVFASLGTKVTILEMMPTILPMIDEDVTKAYTKALRDLGVDVLTSAQVTAVSEKYVSYTLNDQKKTVTSDLVLMAVGTRANSGGLEKLNLKMDRANIVTNEYLETSVKDVYAIGDVNGKYMLAHVASHEGIIAVSHALGKKVLPMDYTKIPQAIYGQPEIASVGLTEKEAKAKGLAYKISTFPLAASGKALADGEKEGFIKLIVDQKYNELLGAHIYAYQATELISELVLGLNLEVTAEELAHAIHPHPSLSEIVMEASLGALDKPIHI